MTTRTIPLDRVRPDPGQPRKRFDDATIAELATSIQHRGLIQPISARADPEKRGHFLIIAGERRHRACCLLRDQRAGSVSIDVNIVTEKDIAKIRMAQLVENMQREEMAPLDEARALAELRDVHGMDEGAIAQQLGLAPFRVRWRLQLLNLDPSVRKLVEGEHLDRQQAMEVARLPEHADQRRVVQMINRRELVGWKAVRNAVEAIIGNTTAADLFGGALAACPRANVATLRGMEGRIDQVVVAIGAGWRDGECVVASMVDPGRAQVLADKLGALRRTLTTMERQLQNASGPARVVAMSEALL